MCTRWLLGAIALSMVLHAAILYIPPLALLFSVTPLGGREWRAVVVLSAPVVLLDELLKLITRCCSCVRTAHCNSAGLPSLQRAGGKHAGYLQLATG